jgi:hypothetical protein
VAYAHIGELPKKYDTLVDRSVTIRLARRLPTEKIESLSGPRRRNEFADLRRKLRRSSNDHEAALADAEPEMPPDLVNRIADNWRPLLAIADAAGGDWPKRAREAISGSEHESSEREMLLADIRDIYDRVSLKDGFISSTALAKELARIEGRPWAVYGRDGKLITTHRVSGLLKPLKICPGPNKARDARGYYRLQFADAFERYLGPNAPPLEDFHLQSVQSVRSPGKMGDSEHFQSVRSGPGSDTLKTVKTLDKMGASDTSDTLKGGILGTEDVLDVPQGSRAQPMQPAPSTGNDPRRYEILLGGVGGQRCSQCGGGAFVRRIRRNGQIHTMHPGCADRYFAAVDEGPEPLGDAP